MRANGLVREKNGLEIYVICEIPNNVIQIDAFAALFDGFSIGSNDLTQLTLGACSRCCALQSPAQGAASGTSASAARLRTST